MSQKRALYFVIYSGSNFKRLVAVENSTYREIIDSRLRMKTKQKVSSIVHFGQLTNVNKRILFRKHAKKNATFYLVTPP